MLGALSITLSVKAAENNSAPALRLIATKRPLVIGHRGYCQIAPENTLPSFQLAVTAGADLVELDYHHSKDDQLIVIHDSELDRTTDARSLWPGEQHITVASRTAAQIKTLDAGAWFDRKFAGTKIPTLGEALDTIQKGSVTLIERKAGEPAACIKLLQSKGLVNCVVVQSFDWHYLKEFHQRLPEQALGALGPPSHSSTGERVDGRKLEAEKQLSGKWLEDLAQTGATVAVWSQQVSKEAVALAHERGLKVWVYTINDSDLANRLLDMGVDGIITNNTSVIWRTIALRSRP
jgi:glycerophosphoryl diester phosphodiesterase